MAYPESPAPGYPAGPYHSAKTGLPVVGWQPFDEALIKALTVDIAPDIEDPDSGIRRVVPVMGAQRSEYASQEDLHPDELQKKGARTTRVTLPAASLRGINYRFNPQRWSRAHYRKLGWTEDGNRVVQSEHPLPFDVTYQLDLWAKFRSTMNQLTHKIGIKFFAREIWLKVNLGGPWGEKKIAVFMPNGNPIDLSDNNPGDNDREIRFAFTFIMQAWMLPDPTMIPTVRKVVMNIAIPAVPGEVIPGEVAVDENDPNPGWGIIPGVNYTTEDDLPKLENP